jgi:hypothetical protein
MFHFPTFPPHTLYIQVQVTRHHSCWVSPFGHPRITARLTAPRGLSQPPTSFIGSWCQGIHRTLFITYNKDARVHCAILKQHTPPRQRRHQTTIPTSELAETIRYSNRESLYMSCLERNTRVFSQDPTVCRYRRRRRNTMVPRSAMSHCQCSTRELPQIHIWNLNGLCQTSSADCSAVHVLVNAP